MNRVIPIAQSIHTDEVDRIVNVIGDFHSELVNRIVGLTNHCQTGGGCRIGNQVNGGLNINKRLSLPALRNIYS